MDKRIEISELKNKIAKKLVTEHSSKYKKLIKEEEGLNEQGKKCPNQYLSGRDFKFDPNKPLVLEGFKHPRVKYQIGTTKGSRVILEISTSATNTSNDEIPNAIHCMLKPEFGENTIKIQKDLIGRIMNNKKKFGSEAFTVSQTIKVLVPKGVKTNVTS